MDDSKIIGIIALITSVGGSIIAVINHKKSRCGLCGKKLEISLDIDQTSPTIAPAPSQNQLPV